MVSREKLHSRPILFASIRLEGAVLSTGATKKRLSKTFQKKVFDPSSTQTQIFDEISQLVQSALDGYCVCIFAYGQTGSGKTFTMEGPPDKSKTDSDMGMIPRTVHKVFEAAESLTPLGWKYTMEAQYIEIYNENIRDLLGDRSEKKHEIKHCPLTSKTYVTNIRSGMYTGSDATH